MRAFLIAIGLETMATTIAVVLEQNTVALGLYILNN